MSPYKTNLLRFAAVGVCTLLLPACLARSVDGARKYEIDFQGTSTKPADAIARCILTAWESKGTTVQYLPTNTGATISVVQPPILLAPALYIVFIDIVEAGGARSITARQFHSLMGGAQARQNVEDVKACV